MKISKVLFLALLGFFSLNSCGGDDDAGASATDNLTGGTWQITESRSDIDGDGTLDDILDACTADDLHDFNADGSYDFDEGATKCDPADPQSDTGTWVLSADEKTLTITQSGFGLAFEVVSLTSSRMELTVDIFGVTETVFTR